MEKSDEYLRFIRDQAQRLAQQHKYPESRQQWESIAKTTRKKLWQSLGGPSDDQVDLAVETHGQIDRDNFTIEKITIQTLRDVRMGCNLYVPSGSGPFPAVLCVHGHWKGAKQDPTVQARCIGLAKLGFIAMAVDALGAGERGIHPELGEYHGEMTAATLWPSGRLLAGLQVIENMRCVDYLQSRRDVASEHIGITGTSGGGNQTLYAGALEPRFKAVVPVCSVGNYQAYLGAACCMCEMIPGALTYMEQWQVLGLSAPRALMVINATQDAVQFSIAEAIKSMRGAKVVFDQYDAGDRIRHVHVESRHDYNQPMREAMYGWVTKHLKNEGDSQPIAEPPIETIDPDELRCFAADKRPQDYLTIPHLANRFNQSLTTRHALPKHREHWEADHEFRLGYLKRITKLPVAPVGERIVGGAAKPWAEQISSEDGIHIDLQWKHGDGKELLLVISADGTGLQPAESEAVEQAKLDQVNLTLRATGRYEPTKNQIGNALDHNAAQWGMWIGRPLVTQWVGDIRQTLNYVSQVYQKKPRITLLCIGEMNLAGLMAAAVDQRIDRLVSLGGPSTLMSDERYGQGSVGNLVPGMLSQFGDIGHLCAMLAPRPLLICDPGLMTDKAPQRTSLAATFRYPAMVYKLLGKLENFRVVLENGRNQWLSILLDEPK